MAVQLVDDDVAQVLEELHPFGVVGQDPLVEHVGVGHDHVGAGADGLAGVGRRISVVGERADVGPQRLHDGVQLGELVLGQGLGREKIESARVRLAKDRVEDGQVVAERLARRGRGHHHRVAAGAGGVVGRALMRVEAGEAARGEHLAQPRVQAFRELGELGGLGLESPQRREDRFRPRSLGQLERPQRRDEASFRPLPPEDELLTHGEPWCNGMRSGQVRLPRAIDPGSLARCSRRARLVLDRPPGAPTFGVHRVRPDGGRGHRAGASTRRPGGL